MGALILPERILSLSADTADRLISQGSGDAALLYLALLRHGDERPARQSLGWTDVRCAAALESLAGCGLVEGGPETAAPEWTEKPKSADEPPDYQRSDLADALRKDADFAALQKAVEGQLGDTLSEADLKSLYTIYDFLSFPPEVVCLLVGWCTRQAEQKYGPGRRPRMPTVKKTAFQWKRLGVDTVQAAEEYLRRQQALLGRETELLALLDIRGRAPVEREREYLAGWVDMGFDSDAIRLAYERTVLQKQKLHWSYMNGILKRWHAAGLHTAAQVEAEDKPPASPPGQFRGKKDFQPSEERIQKNADWLDEFLANQEKREENGKQVEKGD